MLKTIGSLIVLAFVLGTALAARGEISDASQACLDCHRTVSPGIVADWEKSRHAEVSPEQAVKLPELERRVSAAAFPGELGKTVVGCAECHTTNGEGKPGSFDHNGYTIHVVVSPNDCAICHPKERSQFEKNIMAHAQGNLYGNVLYRDLADSINGLQEFKDGKVTLKKPSPEDELDSCLSCHGTIVQAKELVKRETSMGDMEFPVLVGWPNQGVGRVNPDGSKGACTACHARHQFSMAMARKPATCSQCHKGPDVPAYQVYEVSKHGNIYASVAEGWNFNAVPWKIGQDFTAPTCAACHVSLTVNGEGQVVAERTHQMNDRLPWRLFGLIYAHSHPKSPDTTGIKNKDGQGFPTALDGEQASAFLIGAEERETRRKSMQKNCLTCHSRGWVDGHWRRLENTISQTNGMTLTSTRIMQWGWDKRVALGLADNHSIFDEAVEKKWMNQWLFYGNSARFASAMIGADYGVFANGRWKMAENVQDLRDSIMMKLSAPALKTPAEEKTGTSR